MANTLRTLAIILRRPREYMAKRRAIIDRVHDLVYLPTTVARCMDTPYFQRLRGLKQLGVASYVYPGAVHTRFEHSIGVAHLARALIHRIRDAQPDLRLDPADDVVLMLAGLGHDIGQVRLAISSMT
jgi:HD superfamily phosphohydrolase